MAEKEELESRLYERMSQENKAFIAELKSKPPDEIIRNAYEIACRENLVMLFETETSLSVRQLETLLEFEHPLAELYDDWLDRDTDEMDVLRSSIENCADEILNHRAEEMYENPAQGQYERTYAEAVARDEYPEWLANHRRNEKCARDFRKEAADAYHAQNYPAFLQKWEAAYGKDRCMFVLSCTMARRAGDERFYPPARRAAARFTAQREVLGDRTAAYINDVHSVIVNSAMEYLARPARSKQQENAGPKKKEPQQAR